MQSKPRVFVTVIASLYVPGVFRAEKTDRELKEVTVRFKTSATTVNEGSTINVCCALSIHPVVS